MEVRLQGHQDDRGDPFHRAPAADVLEHLGAARIRLIREREPEGRPPTLEPGARAAHRRRPVRLARADTDVQRLRKGSRGAVWEHGSEEILLSMPPSPTVVRRVIKPAVFLLCLVPFALLVWRALAMHGAGLGTNPIEKIQDTFGQWGLRFLLITL